MRQFDIILWDVDNTLLDFDRSERHALSAAFAKFGLPFTEVWMAEYHAINKGLWERLERKEVTKREVLLGRFFELFEKMQLKTDAAFVEEFQKFYQDELASVFFYRDHSDELLARLKQEGFRQFFVTNGVASTQRNKIRLSGLDAFAEKIFISDEIGAEKPDPLFFERSFAEIPDFQRDRAILVGDSPSSDMQGAFGAGVCACFYDPENRSGMAAGMQRGREPDYQIRDLWEIIPILLSEKEV